MTFSDWLNTYLLNLSSDVDSDTFVSYIDSLLEDDSTESAKVENITEFLESVLPPHIARPASEEIVRKFRCVGENVSPNAIHTEVVALNRKLPDDSVLDDLESQMRLLMRKQPIKIKPSAPGNLVTSKSTAEESSHSKQRDACTTAALRAAGVVDYQESEESKSALNVALANAEFYAKQRLVLGTNVTAPLACGNSIFNEDLLEATASPDTEIIDLEELEDASGYGKKEGIKPGNVMDALSALNPNKFGSSQSAAASSATVADLKAGKVKRLPTPGDITSSTTPAYLLMNSRTTFRAPVATVATSNSANMGGPSSTSLISGMIGDSVKKKKPPPPAKHLADIGARAEEKHLKMVARKNQKLCNVPAAGRNRLDDMDAFFISDDESDTPKISKAKGSKKDDLLNAGGGNRERVEEAENAAREKSARDHVERRAKEKEDRAKQLESAAKRKEAAQQRSQKQERRQR